MEVRPDRAGRERELERDLLVDLALGEPSQYLELARRERARRTCSSAVGGWARQLVEDLPQVLRAETNGAAIVRVKDVGYSQLGAQSYALRTSYQGRPATLIAVYQQPGANAIQVSKDVRAELARLSKSFPKGLEYEIALDTTLFVQASIHEVIKTFFEAVVLVVLVVFVFLHSLRLTIIPMLAVPVSILGAMLGMYLLGFSLDRSGA